MPTIGDALQPRRDALVRHEGDGADRAPVDIVSSAPEPKGWKRGISSRLRKIADTIHDDDELAALVAPELPPPPPLPANADPGDTAGRDRALSALITECYPTVAPKVLALVRDGAAAASDDWIIVARLLYEAHMHRVGGPSETARMRALVATFAQALEEQSRSSARLAGYHDAELDNASTIEGDPSGITVWEHYLCPQAKLARQAIHGESVGDWLTALGELWAATKVLADRCEAGGTARGSDPDECISPTAIDRGVIGPTAAPGSSTLRDAPATSPPAPTPAPTALRGEPPSDIRPDLSETPAVLETPVVLETSDAPEADGATCAVAVDDPVLVRARIALARVEELSLW